MAMTGVLRPGHVALRVTDLEAAVKHYGEVLGLIETGRDAQGRVYFKAWDEHDHHSVVLRQADAPGMDYMGFRVDSEATLDSLAAAVEGSRLASDLRWVDAGEHLHTGRRFRFTVPTGHAIELFAAKDKVGNGLPDVNPDPWPDGLRGMQPTRFDHCLLYGDDVDGTVKLFTEVLGFRMAEQVMAEEVLVGAFLTCSTKPHDIAFIRNPEKGRFHHCSFILDTWNDVLRAADLISKHDVSLDIGPTRHGITRGATIYFFDPSGNRNEVYSGGYQYYPDKPTITWTVEDLGRAIFYHDRKLNEAFLNVTPEVLAMASAFDPFRKYVRVTAERDDGFVEFDFALGEPGLFAEMMLTRAAFEEFCAAQDVIRLEGDGAQDGSPFAPRLNGVLAGGPR